MTFIQRLICAFASPQGRAAIQAESESWVWTCPKCQAQRNVWEMGGVRYKAFSRGKFTYLKCGSCGVRSWMPLERIVH